MRLTHAISFAAAAAISLANIAFSAVKMAAIPGMPMGTAPASTAVVTHIASGVVKKTDVAAGKVIIAHGAITTLGWPAMTMGFSVRDKALFSKLIVGKKVDFQLVAQGSDYVVVGVH